MARARNHTLAGDVKEESVTGPLGEAIDDGKAWIKAEIALARAEFNEAVGQYLSAALAWSLALVFALVAVIYFADAAVRALVPAMGEVWAALLVAVVLLAIAAAALFYGRSKFIKASTLPQRVARALNGKHPGDSERER